MQILQIEFYIYTLLLRDFDPKRIDHITSKCRKWFKLCKSIKICKFINNKDSSNIYRDQIT